MHGPTLLDVSSVEFMSGGCGGGGVGRGQSRQEATTSPSPWKGDKALLTMAEHVFVTYETCDLLAQA